MTETNAVAENAASKIIRFHQSAGENLQNAIHCAKEAGKELAKTKEALPHGEFSKWVGDNLPFDLRTAQRYMQLFEHAEEIESLQPSSLSEAYRLFEKQKDVTPPPDDFEGEFSDEEEGERPEPPSLTTEVDAYAKYPYWRNFEKIVKIMDAEYLKLAASRDHTTPVALGHAIGNIKEMSSRIAAWDPKNLFDCPTCGGSSQVEDENGQMTTCSLCINGKVGPFKESEL